MAQFEHNPVGGERPTGGDLLPAGRYAAIITDSRVDDNKAKTGKVMWLERTVTEPAAYKNRKIFQRLNVRNANAQAEEIGIKELNQLLDAVGLGNTIMKDTVQLHGKAHIIDVVVKDDASGNYGPQNEIKRARPLSDGLGNGSATKPAAAPAARPLPFHQQQRPTQQQPAQGAAAAHQQATAQSATGEQSGGDTAVLERPAEQAQQPVQQPAQQPVQAPAITGGVPPWMRRG